MRSSGLKNLCVLFYCQTSYWGAGNINYENNCAHLKYERLILISHANGFLISENKYHKVHVSSPWCMHGPKILTRHTALQITSQSFILPLCGQVVSIDIDTTCIYLRRRQKFQNIIERQLCNCFGQLLLIYQKC